MKNKHGFAFTMTAAVFFAILIAAVTIIVSFVFSKNLRFVIIGIGLLVAFIVLLAKLITSGKKATKATTVFLVLLFISGIFLVFFSGVLQSVLSVSSVNVGSDGKVYWVTTGVANKNGDVFTFTPTKYTANDGSQVIPKESLTLTVSKLQSQCAYATTLQVKPLYTLGIIKVGEVRYYTFQNPEKIVKVSFTDGNRRSASLDGTVTQSVQIGDIDGSGKVTIETQGLLSGKYNCPSPSNVALVYDENNNLKFLYKNEYDLLLSKFTGFNFQTLLGFYSAMKQISLNTDFTSTFINTPTVSSGKLYGDINLGSVVYTITADQDYFNSVIYTPPQTASPEILSISAPQEIKQSSSSSAVVSVRNKNSDTALASITTSSSFYSVSPSSTNLDISPSAKSFSFIVNAPNSVGTGTITFTACGVSQFGSASCDTESISIKTISSSEEPITKCGDNVCQSSETFNTCPADCTSGSTDDNKDICLARIISEPLLGWTWEESSTSSCGFNPLCWVGVIPPITTTSGQCKPTFAVFWVIIGIVVVSGIGTTAYLISKKKRRKR